MKTSTYKNAPPIIFFDSVCILCHYSVRFLIRLDKKKILRYSTLQGEKIKSLAIETSIDSIVFYDDEKIYYKSTAILKIFYRLGGFWKGTNIFYILPLLIRDFIYDTIAKHRYKVFGKLDACSLPKEGYQRLFIP